MTFRYSVPRAGALHLTYIEAPTNMNRTASGYTHWRPCHESPIELSFELRTGDFSGDMDTGTESGPWQFSYQWALDLDKCPYPAELNLAPGFLAREHEAGPFKTLYGHGGQFRNRLSGIRTVTPPGSGLRSVRRGL